MTEISYQTPAQVTPFEDRSTMLLVVGVLFIMAGALCGCLTLAMPLSVLAPRPAGAPQQRVATMVVGFLVYAGLCAALLALGIGCVRKRRWVRPLILVFAAIGLVCGLAGIVMSAFALPHMGSAMRAAAPAGAGTPPPAFYNTMIVVMTVFFVVIYLIVPAALLLLFRPISVQATLIYYDPNPRWTDALPVPVLALCVLLVIGGLWPLTCAMQGWFFAFGALLTGPAARVVALLVSAAFAVATWLAFRRRPAGWWTALALFTFVPLAWIVTLLRHDLVEVYRASGMSDEELRAIGNMPTANSTLIAVSTAVMALAAVAFTVRTRKYFTTLDLSPLTPPAPSAAAPQ